MHWAPDHNTAPRLDIERKLVVEPPQARHHLKPVQHNGSDIIDGHGSVSTQALRKRQKRMGDGMGRVRAPCHKIQTVN